MFNYRTYKYRIVFSIILLSYFFITKISFATVPTPLSSYALDGTGTTTPTTAPDSVSGNNGTLVNGPTWTTDRLGAAFKAISFDGVNDYVNLSSPSSLDNLFSGSGGTFSAWIYPKTYGENNFGRLFDKTGVQGGITLLLNNGVNNLGSIRLNQSFNNAASYTTVDTPTNSVSLNQWTHVVLTYDGTASGGIKIYFNGNLQTLTYATTGIGTRDSDAAYNLLIGNRTDTTRTFNGYMDDIQIFNT